MGLNQSDHCLISERWQGLSAVFTSRCTTGNERGSLLSISSLCFSHHGLLSAAVQPDYLCMSLPLTALVQCQPPCSHSTSPSADCSKERNGGSLEGAAVIPGSGVISKSAYRWGQLPGTLVGKSIGFQGFVFQQKYAERELFSHIQDFPIKMIFKQIPHPPVKAV